METKIRAQLEDYITVWELFHRLVPDKIDIEEFESFLNSDIVVYIHSGDIDAEVSIEKELIKFMYPKIAAERERGCGISNEEYELYISDKMSDFTKYNSIHQSKILKLKKLEGRIKIEYDYDNECYSIKSGDYSEAEKFKITHSVEIENGIWHRYDKINRLYIKKDDYEKTSLKYDVLCDCKGNDIPSIISKWEQLLESKLYENNYDYKTAIKIKILKLRGLGSKEIANKLGLSGKSSHANILRKYKKIAEELEEKHDIEHTPWWYKK